MDVQVSVCKSSPTWPLFCTLLYLYVIRYFILFWPHHEACRTSVPCMSIKIFKLNLPPSSLPQGWEPGSGVSLGPLAPPLIPWPRAICVRSLILSLPICKVSILQSALTTSLAVQWLRLCTPNAGGLGSISGQGTRSHKVKGKVAQSCLTPCDPMDYTVHGILQARMLERVALPFSRGFPQARDWTQVSHIVGRFFTVWATREAHKYWSGYPIPPPGDLPNSRIELGSPALQAGSLPMEIPGKPKVLLHIH